MEFLKIWLITLCSGARFLEGVAPSRMTANGWQCLLHSSSTHWAPANTVSFPCPKAAKAPPVGDLRACPYRFLVPLVLNHLGKENSLESLEQAELDSISCRDSDGKQNYKGSIFQKCTLWVFRKESFGTYLTTGNLSLHLVVNWTGHKTQCDERQKEWEDLLCDLGQAST